METFTPIGDCVARNVRALRDRRGLSVRELSARMGELGRPILPSGITKIEQGQRRVDADDLVALAVALRVNVNVLLLPANESLQPVHLTSEVTARWWRAWEWATGEAPLDVPDSSRLRLSELAEWFETTRPHKTPDEIAAEVAAARQARLTRQEADLAETDAEVQKAQARWREQQGG